MLSALSRLLGLASFAVAIVALVADGIRSIAAGKLSLTPIGDSWASIDRHSLDLIAEALRKGREGGAAEEAFMLALSAPTLVVAGLAGLALLWLGRRRLRRPRRLVFR